MARLIVNKHFDKHNDAANGFSTEQEYAFGEIIICNDKETPSIYIKDKENNSIGISNVKVINEDKILSKTNGGELYTSLEMVWDNINHQIKLYGNDKNIPISAIDIFGEDNIANDINKSIERVVDITAVKYTYENVPAGLKPNRDYFKISVFNDNTEKTQYLPYVKEETGISISSGDDVILIENNSEGIKISHASIEQTIKIGNNSHFGESYYIENIDINNEGHISGFTRTKLPLPNTTLTKVIDKESNIDAQPGWYVTDVKPEGDGLKYKVEYAELPSTEITKEDITPEIKEQTRTFISDIEVNGNTIKYKKSDVDLNQYFTKDEANKTFIDSDELDAKLQNLGLNPDGTLPEVKITVDNSSVGDGKYISNIEVDSIDKTKLTLITTDIGLDKYVDKESVVLKTDNVLSWGEEKEIAQIGDKNLKIALPSKHGIKVSVDNVDKTDGTYVLVGVNESETDINELVFSKREFDVDSTLTIKSITPQENVLAWGKSVNVATIGDKDIAVQLPEDIIVIENTSEKSNTQVVTNITIDDNDPTKLKVNYEDLIPKNIVSEEIFNTTLKTYLTANDIIIDEEETQDVKFVTSITPSKNDDNDLILTLEKENITNVIDGVVSVESNTPVLEWDRETSVAKIGNKEIKVKMPSQPDKADGNTRYKLSGGVEDGEFKVTLSEIGENEDDGGSAAINFSTDIPEKEITVIDEGEGKYVTSISTDINDKHSIIVSREDVDLSGYLKENALEGYAQQSWVTEKITEAVTSGTVDLSEYAKIQYVDEKFVKTETLNAYATQEWIDEKGFITSIPDDYVTESEIDAYNFVKETTLENYVTKTDIPSIVITGDTDGNTVSNIEVIDGGHTLKLTKTNISLKESDLVINESGEGEIVTDITNNGHNITITKGNIEHPKATVSNKAITLTAKEGLQTIAEIDGTPITIQLDPNLTVNGDIPTIKTYVLTGETQGKKTTIKLLDEANVESGSHSIDLSEFSTTSEIDSLLTNKNYATQEWVTDKSYATENFVTSQNFLKSNALDAYATQEWIDGKGFITSIPDEYVTENEIDTYNFVKTEVLEAYATQEWVNEQKYLTSIPDEYATQNWVTDTALNGYVKNNDITDKYADKNHEHNSSEIKDSIQDKNLINKDTSELVQGKAIYGFIEDKLNNYIKKGEETEYVLPTADKDVLGGIKVGYQNDGNNRNYAVNIDKNGNAFVNVPWEEVKNYLPNDEEVPVDLHYTPSTEEDVYTAAEGKYISGIKYDKKQHIVGINEENLPSEVNQAKSLSVGNVGSDTKPVIFVDGKPVEVTNSFLTGITSNDVTDALGFTPLSAETKYNGSTFIKIDSNTISAITGETENTLAVGNHSHEQYQIKGNYIEDIELGTLTFESGNFETTTFKANGDCTVKVPTHTSHITNDSNYITSGDISLSIEGKGCLTGGGTITNGESVEIFHETKIVTLSNSVSTLDNSDDFAVQTVEYDNYGHINKIHKTTYTLNVTLDGIGAAPETHRHNIDEIDGVDDYLAINDAMIFKGTITGENSFPQTFEAGWTYKVATAGTYFEQKFEVGDMVIAVKDATTSTTTTSSNFTTYWAVVQTNTDGIVIGPSESVSGNIPVFDNATGKLIKDSGISINDVLTEETFKGTVTAVNINGVTKQPNNEGVVDLGSYLTGFTESDPIFTNSVAYSISDSDITTWNNKIDNTYCYSKDEVDNLLENINDSDENVKVSNNTTDTIYLIGVTTTGETTDGTVKNNNVYIQDNALIAPNGTFETLLTDKLTVDGDITVHGVVSGATAYYQDSDERLKDFGEDIDVDFNKLKEIPKKYFTWKSDDTKKIDLGTSAQKVRELYPELVGGEDDTTLSVDYAKLSIIALKAVDKLHEENEMLRAELAIIKKHLGL